MFKSTLLCGVTRGQTNIFLPWNLVLVGSRRRLPRLKNSRYLLERLNPKRRLDCKGEPRSLPSEPSPPLPPSKPAASCNPAAVEGIYCCAPLFDARCTYLHFSTLRSFHVRRLRIKYTRGGFVRGASFWGPLCRRRGCAQALAC